MAKKRVFVSFDFDNDKALKDFIIGQARLPDSPFEVVDTSLKEAAPMKTWEDKARAAIKRSDLVLVMVGPTTHKAPGVLKEVKMAREENVPIVQIIGYRDGNYTAVPDAGRLYAWNWDNLKKLLG
jgi:predicted GTPase